jgi:hypothetical protein
VEISHVGLEEPAARVLLARKADERGVQVQAIHGEAFSRQEPRVLARAAGHVENRSTSRIELSQQISEQRRLQRVARIGFQEADVPVSVLKRARLRPN